MAVISKGIKLYMGDVELENLQEIPAIGGTAESIEVTTLASVAHEYTNGILNYGDSLAFKFLYAKEQFATLAAVAEAVEWRVELPDGASCTFSGSCSVALDGVGVNAALTYTLSIKPNSAMVWA